MFLSVERPRGLSRGPKMVGTRGRGGSSATVPYLGSVLCPDRVSLGGGEGHHSTFIFPVFTEMRGYEWGNVLLAHETKRAVLSSPRKEDGGSDPDRFPCDRLLRSSLTFSRTEMSGGTDGSLLRTRPEELLSSDRGSGPGESPVGLYTRSDGVTRSGSTRVPLVLRGPLGVLLLF